MTMSKRNLGLIVATIIVAIGVHLVTVSVGQPVGPSPRGGGDRGMLVRWLGLRGEKAETVATEDASFRRDMRRLDRRIQIEQLELASLIESDDATDEQLSSQFDTLANAHLAVHKRIAAHVLAVRPHLDADQRARFGDLLARHLRGQKPGRPGGPGGPQGRPGRPGGPGPRPGSVGGPGGPPRGPGHFPPPPGGHRDGPPQQPSEHDTNQPHE